jgi:hypothetical protein
MRILYKPFAMLAGVIGAKLGRRTFHSIWGAVDENEPPKPTTADAPLSKVLAAATLEAATMAAIGAIVDRAVARAFHHLFGAWPGPSTRKKSD